jgi:competence protein ComEA
MDAPTPAPAPAIPATPAAVATAPAAPPQAPSITAVPPQAASIVTAWPRSAQLTTAFLLGVSVTLLCVHLLGLLRWGTRPAELERERPPTYRIDLNRASRAELLQVPGIGPSLADRIEAYSREHGGFQSVDELTRVRGIGPATLDRVRPWLCVNNEDVPVDLPTPSPRAAASAMDGGERKVAGKKETNLSAPIDINRASAEELQRLSGVGPVLSQRIIDERSKRPFKSVDDLRRVSGIGPKTLARLRPNITVSVPSPLAKAEE